LIYNFKPASIFMGDAGALASGLALGMLSSRAADDCPDRWWLRSAVLLLVVMVPLIDMSVATARRFATSRPIWKGSRDHSADLLVGLGLSERGAAVLLYALAFIMGTTGVIVAAVRPVYAVTIASFALLFSALIGTFLTSVPALPSSRIRLE